MPTRDHYRELAGQGRKQRDRVKEDEDIFKRRSDDEANKLRKNNKKKKKSLAAVPLFKRQAGVFVRSHHVRSFFFNIHIIHPTRGSTVLYTRCAHGSKDVCGIPVRYV